MVRVKIHHQGIPLSSLSAKSTLETNAKEVCGLTQHASALENYAGTH